MGKSNRQRRAAKARQRVKERMARARAPITVRGHSVTDAATIPCSPRANWSRDLTPGDGPAEPAEYVAPVAALAVR